jgi:WD40 repeat protein/tRNA A-37 threonylcarbamoyl transferase component Bud32
MQIGKGGMGVVYKAEDRLFKNRLVAVKEMSQSGLSPQELREAIEAFEREAYLLVDLRHPSLPKIYDHFDEAGRWYLVMDFIEGENLEKYLEKAPGGRFPVNVTLKIGIKLCNALDYLHSHQPPIIFRDLKPANIICTPSGELFLIDFGIARLFKPGQARDTVSYGSVGYSAPEQFGKLTTPQSDIYSLGALLHHMLSGRDPATSTPNPFIFPPLSRVPAKLDRLVGQMVQMNAANRPASMAAVKQELQQIAAQLAGKRPPPPTPSASKAAAVSKQSMLSPSQTPVRSTKKVSRRVVIIGLATLGLAVAGGGLELWIFAPHPLYTYNGHSDRVNTVAWSPDGTYIASGSTDETVQVWDADTGNCVLIYRGHWNSVNVVAWSPNSIRIASGDGTGTVQVWDADSGSSVYIYRGHSDRVNALAWSPDGKRLASASNDTTVQVWDATNGSHIYTYRGHSNSPYGVNALAWSPDGTRIVSGSNDGTAQVWNAADGGYVFSYQGHARYAVHALAWSPDGTRIASGGGDGTVQVWDADSGSHVYIYRGHTQYVGVNTVAWSPDGTRIVSGSNDGTAQVWDAADGGHAYIYQGHSAYYLGHFMTHAAVNGVTWSPNGTRIASGSSDKTVQVWQAEG